MPARGRSCETCEFVDMGMSDTGPVLECHVMAPTQTDASQLIGDEDFEIEVGVALEFPRYPVVEKYDWCSSYEKARPEDEPLDADTDPEVIYIVIQAPEEETAPE